MRPSLTRTQLASMALVIGLCGTFFGVDIHNRSQAPPTVGTAYVLVQDVPAGARIRDGDYREVLMTTAPSDLGYLGLTPNGLIASRPLRGGNVLTSNDFLPATARTATVAVALTGAPPIGAGDMIDIYLSNGPGYQRVGAHVPVVGTNPITLEVPVADAPLWLALADSHRPLLATVTTDTAASDPRSVDFCTAVRRLTGGDCTGNAVPTGSAASNASVGSGAGAVEGPSSTPSTAAAPSTHP